MAQPGGGYLARPAPSGLADVIELVLDKGLVLDAYVRISLLGIDTAEVRRRRQELQDRAEPQRGVDALRGSFTGTAALPGVEDAEQSPPARRAGPDSSIPGPTDEEEHA